MNNEIKKQSINKGFTLIEVIGILAILSIIMVITLPLLNKSNKNSDQLTLTAYVKNFEIAVQTYLQINKEQFKNFQSPGQSAFLSIKNLISTGLISDGVTNPSTGKKEKDNNNYIEVSINDSSEYEYAYLTGDETQNYISVAPSRLEALEQKVAALETRLSASENKITTLQNTYKTDNHPVGSIYISTSSTNPNSLFGGTWVAYGQGRTIIGVGSGTDSNSVSNSFSAGATGGEYTHTLTINEMPSHFHRPYGYTSDNLQKFQQVRDLGTNATGRRCFTAGSSCTVYAITTDTSATDTAGVGEDLKTTNLTEATGGGGSHNNIQPYITVYMWQRTA